METLALGGEAWSTHYSGHTVCHKHLEQAPGPCLLLYLVMKKQMPRCNQKHAERVWPRSNFWGGFCDQKKPMCGHSLLCTGGVNAPSQLYLNFSFESQPEMTSLYEL